MAEARTTAPRPAARGAGLAAAALWLALAAPAGAQPSTGLDYDVESRAWNGLGRLRAIARGMNLEVVAVTQIDWEELGPGDVLFLLYPKQRVQPTHLYHFIRGGGRVLLADDFGDTGEILARLGLQRENRRGVAATRFHDDLAFAPIATPFAPDHPLAAGVTELATNHPAVFTAGERGTTMVFGFGPGEGVVAAGELAGNRFVALSDPSVLINRMLEFPGNLQFAINLLRYLARDAEPRRLIELTGDFALYGEPSGWLDGQPPGQLARMLRDFNRWLDDRNDYLLKTRGLHAIAIIAALLVTILGLVVLPLRGRPALDGAWTRAARAEPGADDFERTVARYDDPARHPDYLLPAAVLRDTVDARLARLLDRPQPLHGLSADQLVSEVALRAGPAAGAATRRLHRRLTALPSRAQAASPWSVGALSRRDFERLHDEVDRLFALLGDDR
jgi:hypothetical protein